MTKSVNIISCTLFLFIFMNDVSGQSNPLADTYFLKAIDFKNNMKPDSALIYYDKAAIEFQKLGDFEKFIRLIQSNRNYSNKTRRI